MASILRVNTLTDASSNNSVATSVIHSGTAKMWLIFTGTSTVTNRGSYNVSSITDVGTGTYAPNFTNNMGDTGYSSVVSGDMYGVVAAPSFNVGTTNRGYTTSSVQGNSVNPSGSVADAPAYQFSINGDLA